MIDPAVLQKIRDNDPTLTYLELSKVRLAAHSLVPARVTMSDVFEALEHNTHLLTLNFQSRIGMSGLRVLAEGLNKTNLQSLVFSHDMGTKNHIQPLCEALQNNKTLIYLKLREKTLNDESLIQLADALASNNTLTTLEVFTDSITYHAYNNFEKILSGHHTLVNITVSLATNSTYVKPFQPHAKSNHIARHIIQLRPLPELPVESLSQEFLMEQLASNLSVLNLRRSNLGSHGVKILVENQHFCRLVKLNLEENDLTIFGIKTLAENLVTNTTLSHLDLTGNLLQDDSANMLALALEENKTLLALYLTNNEITSTGVKVFADCLKDQNKTLLLLELWGNPGNISEVMNYIDDALLRNQQATQKPLPFRKLPILSSFKRRIDTPKSPQTLPPKKIVFFKSYLLPEHAGQIHGLSMLNLCRTSIGDEGIIKVATILKDNPSLIELNLINTRCTSLGAIELAKALEINTKLEMLHLDHNYAANEGAIAFSSVLEVNRTLMMLDLTYNRIGLSGIQALTRIKENKKKINPRVTINFLDNKPDYLLTQDLMPISKERVFFNIHSEFTFKQNKIKQKERYNELNLDSRPGIALLTNFLGRIQQTRGLNILSLCDSYLGDSGVIKVAAILKDNPGIIELNLFRTGCTHQGARELANALKTNTHLETLHLDSNHIADEGAVAFSVALAANKTLITLYLMYNRIGFIGTRALIRIQEIKKKENPRVTISFFDNMIDYWSEYSLCLLPEPPPDFLQHKILYVKINPETVQYVVRFGFSFYVQDEIPLKMLTDKNSSYFQTLEALQTLRSAISEQLRSSIKIPTSLRPLTDRGEVIGMPLAFPPDYQVKSIAQLPTLFASSQNSLSDFSEVISNVIKAEFSIIRASLSQQELKAFSECNDALDQINCRYKEIIVIKKISIQEELDSDLVENLAAQEKQLKNIACRLGEREMAVLFLEEMRIKFVYYDVYFSDVIKKRAQQTAVENSTVVFSYLRTYQEIMNASYMAAMIISTGLLSLNPTGKMATAAKVAALLEGVCDQIPMAGAVGFGATIAKIFLTHCAEKQTLNQLAHFRQLSSGNPQNWYHAIEKAALEIINIKKSCFQEAQEVISPERQKNKSIFSMRFFAEALGVKKSQTSLQKMVVQDAHAGMEKIMSGEITHEKMLVDELVKAACGEELSKKYFAQKANTSSDLLHHQVENMATIASARAELTHAQSSVHLRSMIQLLEETQKRQERVREYCKTLTHHSIGLDL